MSPLRIQETKPRDGRRAWQVIRDHGALGHRSDLVGRIEWLGGQHRFSMRGYMPSFTAAELRHIADFIEELP